MNVRSIANPCLLLCLTLSSGSFAGGQAGGQPSLADLRAACGDDAQRLCAGVQQGGGRVVACLKEHKDALSDRCKKAAGLPVSPTSTPVPSAASSPAASAARVAEPSVAPAAAANKAPAAGAVSTIGGEKFSERVLTDTEHEGMRAATIHIPEKWSFESKIEWHYDRIEVPLIVSSHAENPDNAEAYFQYPLLRAEIVDVTPRSRQYTSTNKNKPGDHLPRRHLVGPYASDEGYGKVHPADSPECLQLQMARAAGSS